eukprot:gene17429-12462_t
MAGKMLPVLFLSHGGGPAHLLESSDPIFSTIDKNSPSADFLRNLPRLLRQENKTNGDIRCILVISAHWEEPQFTVEYPLKNPKLYYDYYGFPDEAYAPHTTYPVKTDLAVADRVIAQIEAASQGKWRVAKKERGFDHGVFIPLKVAFPEANIPVVQLSLKEGLSMREHIQLGEYLRPLRSEGVLIVTSGQITHNLRMMRSGDPNVKDPKSVEFCEYICRLLESTTPENYEEHKRRLVNIADLAPHFYYAHPRPEHFVPIAVAFGASFVPQPEDETESPQDDSEGDAVAAALPEKFAERIYNEVVMGSMGIDSYLFR